MRKLRSRYASVLAVAVAAVQLGCGGDGIVLPDEGTPAHIEAVGGNGQSGPAGGTLPQPVVVRVTDSRDRPVENQDVVFTPGPGAGSVAPATVKTNADGRASTAWTLGAGTGQQQLVAKASGGSAPANLTTTITATAVAGAASTIAAAGGDDQTGAVGSALSDSLVVLVTDAESNPVAGVEVSWSVSGGGSIAPTTVVTGTDGRAAAERVLGPSSGAQSAQATAAGLAGSPVTFSHTAVPANPTDLVKVSGDAQSAPAGFPLPDSLVVRLVDPNGNGVGGRPVTWVVGNGEGSVEPVNAVTTPQGYAVTRWTMPAATGVYSIDAVFSGLAPVGFSATATADVPTTIALLSGNNQSATVGSQLPAPLRVKVTDGNGNAVENVSVTWTANTGGSVSATTTGTDAQGIAEVTRTLGVVPGTYTTTAAVDGLQGSPVTFTSTATVGPPAKLAITTEPSSSAQSGSPLAQQPVVQVQDALGNKVASEGRTVTAGVVGATLTNFTAVTDATGKATFSGLTLTGPAGGPFNLTFTSGTLLPVTSATDITLGVGAAAKLAVERAPSSSVGSGVVFPVQPRIQVTDAAGSPVPESGHVVTVAITAGGGTLGGTVTATSDANGLATFSGLSISGAAGTRTLQFTSPGLTSVTASVTVGAGGAANVEINAGDGQVDVVGTVLDPDPSVKVTDGSGNPVPGVTVVFTVIAGGGSRTGGSPTTNASGVAVVGSWKIGNIAGTNKLKAVVAGVDSVTFTATGVAGPATQMAAVSALTQSATVGTAVAAPPSVRVRDTFGNNVSGATVTFTLTAAGGGNGSISPATPASVPTGSDGVATLTSWTLGSAAGTNNNTVVASLGALPDVTFQASGTVGGAAKIAINAGDGQSAEVNTAVATDPSVLVTDAGDNPVSGVTVTFTVQSGDGNVTPGSATTNASGIATVTSWTLGPAEGSNTLSASAAGAGSVTFNATGTKAATTVGLQSSLNPSTAGTQVTFTATVSESNPGAPTGTVTFFDGATEIGTGSLSGGQATFSTDQLAEGSHSITAVYGGDGGFTGSTSDAVTQQVDPPPNSPPISVGDGFGVQEDNTLSPAAGAGVLANDDDPDGDPLTAVLVDPPSHASSFTLNPDGSFSYQPSPDYNGPDSFTYQANDGSASSAVTTVSLTVSAVNDPPSFTAGADQQVSSLLTSTTGVAVPLWAQNVSPGPADEAGQTVTFELSTSDDAAFQDLPAVSDSGTLTFRPGLRGDTEVVTVTVTAHDSQGGASAPQSFTITIDP